MLQRTAAVGMPRKYIMHGQVKKYLIRNFYEEKFSILGEN